MLAFNFHNVWSTFIHLLLPFFLSGVLTALRKSQFIAPLLKATPLTELQSTREREKRLPAQCFQQPSDWKCGVSQYLNIKTIVSSGLSSRVLRYLGSPPQGMVQFCY